MIENGNGQGPRPADPPGLARLRSELGQARGKRRVDLILDHPDPEAMVRALPADEIYYLIREVGLADGVELVRLASPEQFRAFVDLDAWRGDAIDPAKVLPWLRAARAGGVRSERDMDRWKRKLAALDPELVSLVLMSTLRMHDLGENPDPEIHGDRFMRTPEGRYVIEFTAEGTEYLAVRGLVDDLYAEEPLQATRTIAAVRWEFRSELEESELRWRTGRLADLGFPDRQEALSWFARPPSKRARPPGEPVRAAGFFLAQFGRGSLLDRAAARLPSDERSRFEVELVTAANAVMVADVVDTSDLDAVRAAVEAARAMLEMGLESLSGGDEQRAADALSATALKRVFQHGFGRTLDLKWRAERLFGARDAGTREAPLIDPPIGEAMSALARKRPAYFPGIEVDRREWGTVASGAFEPRPFLSPQDLERTATALDLAEALAGLARRLGLLPAPAGAAPTARLSALYLTALANERLGRAFRPDPLPPSDLATAAGLLVDVDDPRLAAEGEAGALLAKMAANRARELVALRDRGWPAAEHVTAVLLRP